MARVQLTVAQLATRRDELSRIAAQRPLLPQEQAERDNLDQRFYMREWRRQMRIAEQAIQHRAPKSGAPA